ncbi:hypothetical protein KCU62_g340, partial [Aureobasidium sp. EXF-3399]
MSEWRQRGYVPDSDEEEIVLDDNDHTNSGNHAGDHVTTRSPTRENQRYASEELFDDSGVPERAVSTRKIPKYWEPITSSPQSSQDTTFELPQEHLETPRAVQKPTAGQPIVLITQTRRAESPPEFNKNARTYSKKFKPGALRRIKSTVKTTENFEQDDGVEDDEFMDIDALVSENGEPEQAPPSSAPLFAPSQTGRRLSVSSSDLSDVDMDLISSPQPVFLPPTSTARTTDSIPRLPSQPEATALEDAINSLSDQHLAELAAQQPRRNLRTRKAIQLHPYLIDLEQYRRTLKARGLRPIQIATNSQRPRDQHDSQDAEFHQEESQPRRHQLEHTQESTPPDSSASPVRQQPPRLDLSSLLAEDQDEFPDIDAAIRRHVIGGTQIHHKRRKTLETPHTDHNGRELPSSTARARGRLKSLNLNRTQTITNGGLRQDLLLPSPPRTSSPANVEVTPAAPPRFRLPHGLTSAAVQTPLPSSPELPPSTSVRRSRQIVLSSDDDDPSNANAGVQVSSSSESDQNDRQLMRMRRKIKGVLPASYLKLDRQVRQPSPSVAPSEARLETPRPTAPVRGVAQRRIGSNSITLARQNSHVVFSDNSGSDGSDAELAAPRLLQTRLPSPITGRPQGRPFETPEVDEHDEIDDMLPTVGRSHFRLPGNKRQSKLPSTFTRTKSSSHAAHTGQKRKVTGDTTARTSASYSNPRTITKAATRMPKPIKLSILDVTTSNEPKSPREISKPQFVRLAARQARNRPDHGRHSPTNKDVRLATREDTQDALEPLMSWQAGNLSRSWKPPAQHSRAVGNDTNASEPVRPDDRQEESADRGAPIHRRPGQPRPFVGARPTRSQQLREGSNNARKRTAPGILRANQRNILERNHRMRPAQLETAARVTNRVLEPPTFAAAPSRLMEIFARDRPDQPASKFRLERFLNDRDDRAEAAVPDQMPGHDTDMTGTEKVALPSRPRKRLARRFDVETAKFRQPNEPLPVNVPSISAEGPEPANLHDTPEHETLTGLGAFGTRYPTDFDVRPLEVGTYLATSTFVGSGDFSDCLTLRNRDLDMPAGRITVEVTGRLLHWSAWDEEVSAGLGTILSASANELHGVGEFEGEEMRQTAIEDTIARFDYFLRSIVRYLSGCIHFLDPIDRSSSLDRLSRFVDEFEEMVEAEIVRLKSHSHIRAHVDRLVVDTLLYLLCITAQSVVVSRHPAAVLRQQTLFMQKCVRLSSKVIAAALPSRLTTIREFLETHREHAKRDSGIQEQDIAIKSIVIVNHVLRTIDASNKLADILTTHLGHAIAKSCNIHSLDQIWYDLFSVQPLLEIDAQDAVAANVRAVPSYQQSTQPYAERIYVRLHWARYTTSLLVTISRSSPKKRVKARHAFWKILTRTRSLVVGLRGLQELLPENKNKKSLTSHSMHYATITTCYRPRLGYTRSIPALSSRAIQRSGYPGFMAEAQYAAAKTAGSTDISPEMLEMTITANQRSIFAILQDLLLAMQNAVKIAKAWSTVRDLVEQSNVIEVLKLFDLDQPRLSIAIIEALDIVNELLVVKNRLRVPKQQESQPGSDDSQDYGDWSFMDQVVEDEPVDSEPKTSEVAFLQEPLTSLLSTCFGSEKSPDDALLKKLVGVWTATAQQFVNEDTHDWSSFLDVYSSTSWFQLRTTEQRHKYTCYFLASVIKSDKASLTNHRALFIKAWFVSLFERESMLKFQHRITANLLERATSEPLLHNLPFAAGRETGEYRITLADLRQRRISLIGSVLANMHTSLNSIDSSSTAGSKREYVDMLKAAMQHMRGTYEQLQNLSGQLGGSSYENVKGAYVEFVQSIISLMQQHTSDICPIDPFFVDSAAFPLPVDDPTYVKAKLKSYDSKLGDSRARKQLAVFLQTVSERAASENQQPYLIKQMYETLIGGASRELRNVILTALLPAYIQCSSTFHQGCILAAPLIEASAMVIHAMIYDLDLADEESTKTDVDTITCVLAVTQDFALSVQPQMMTRDMGCLRVLAAIFDVAEQSLTFVEYVHRARGAANDAMNLLHRIMALGDKLSRRIMDTAPDAADMNISISLDGQIYDSVHCSWQDTLNFATRNLSDSLARAPQKNWNTDLASFQVESMRVVAAIEMFRRSYNMILGGYVVQNVVEDLDSDVDEEAEKEEEQEVQRLGVDEMIRGLQELGWQNDGYDIAFIESIDRPFVGNTHSKPANSHRQDIVGFQSARKQIWYQNDETLESIDCSTTQKLEALATDIVVTARKPRFRQTIMDTASMVDLINAA